MMTRSHSIANVGSGLRALSMLLLPLLAVAWGGKPASSAEIEYEGTSVLSITTSSAFDDLISNNEGIAIFEIYADWCPKCQDFAPDYKLVAEAFKGTAPVVAINGEKPEMKEVGSRYNVNSFPSVLIFRGPNDKAPLIHTKDALPTAESVVTLAISGLSGLTSSRLYGGEAKKADISTVQFNKDIELIPYKEFGPTVGAQEDELWFVEFYAPWCQHCKETSSEFSTAATSMRGRVKFGAVNCDAKGDGKQTPCEKYNIQRYPTLLLFYGGRLVEQYSGDKTEEDYLAFLQPNLAKYSKESQVAELTSQTVFDRSCEGRRFCVVLFVPDLLDTQASGRQAYIDMLMWMGEKFKLEGWGFLWTAIGTQEPLQRAAGGIAVGPAMVALNTRTTRYASFRGRFDDEEEVESFLRGLMSGRSPTSPAATMDFGDIAEVTPWDGGEAEVEMFEEEFDLADLMDD